MPLTSKPITADRSTSNGRWTTRASSFPPSSAVIGVGGENKANEQTALEYPGHPVLLHGGKCAAGGVVTGRVLLQQSIGLETSAPPLEPDTILVARTASTTFTPWVSKIRGIITDVGGTASHLASVAREFGVPALFDPRPPRPR